ncbi:hypothetical protein AAEP93_009525 [Penicillium crustosum]
MIVCCEAGGFIYAFALVSQVDVPVGADTRGWEATPTHYVRPQEGASVVVVDDVLATGNTLCAVLQLLSEVGIADVSIMVVAEFPVHRGRQLLHQHGFGVNIQSLLVFDGA